MARRVIPVGLIGGGLMGREAASAFARWCHLVDRAGSPLPFAPRLAAVCDTSPAALAWFTGNFPDVRATPRPEELLADPGVEAVYIAVPHHLHESLYVQALEAGKHLLGEKPFGVDREANRRILQAVRAHPGLLARCSSEFPFFPGALQIARWAAEGRFGRLIEVEAGFWHSSDLDPAKPINWKRRIAENGEYGCLGDLGMHVVHLPFRAGWRPRDVRALLSKIVSERPDREGRRVPCETWDNAVLACEASSGGQRFPQILSTKRIAPGETDTWFIRVTGTALSAAFSTKSPRQLRSMPYVPGGPQAWQVQDLGYASAYPAITGGIFEFGFPDAVLQMWAAFLDELANGRQGMLQPFHCATPEETAASHDLFTAALESQRTGGTVLVGP